MKKITIVLFVLAAYSCGSDEKTKENVEKPDSAGTYVPPVHVVDSIKPEKYEARELVIPKDNPEIILNVDLEQDITKLSLQETRLLKNAMLAKYGYLFMEADLRG